MGGNESKSNDGCIDGTERIVSVGPLNLSAKEAQYLSEELAARMEIENGERSDVYERIYWKLQAAINVGTGTNKGEK